MAPKRLLLVGGGHAHMGLLKRASQFIEAGAEVSLLSPEEYHIYSGMGPGRVGGTYGFEDYCFPVRRLIESAGGSFLRGSAIRIDPKRKVVLDDEGSEHPYNVASFNVGSVVPYENLVSAEESHAIGETVFPAKPVRYLELAARKLEEVHAPVKVAVVGGGPGGVELAANAAWTLRERGVGHQVSLYAASKVVRTLPRRFRTRVLNRLERLGVNVREGCPVEAVGDGWLRCQGTQQETGITFLATGVVPPPLFRDSGLPVGPRGGLLVNRYLSSPVDPNIFGGGDCIDLEDEPLDRVGVYAVRETEYLEHNLRATLWGGTLRPFSTSSKYLLICNLAGGYGVATKYGVSGAGRVVGLLKRLIDRSFVRSHQKPTQ